MKKYLPYILASILALFGVVTLFLSTSIILDLFDVRAKEGNYVLFVVWANFVCSILYLFAAYGFIKDKIWTARVLIISAILLIVTFVGFELYINAGGIYEQKTVGALVFRTLVTLAFAITAYMTITKKKIVNP